MCVHSPGFSCQPCGDLYAADDDHDDDTSDTGDGGDGE